MRSAVLYTLCAALYALLDNVKAGQVVFNAVEPLRVPPQPSNVEPGYFVNERVPSIPLIVKSPYLQAWMPVGSKQPRLAGKWCEFWTGQQQGWTGFIRVDGHAYTFMGDPSLYGQSLAIQQSYKVLAMLDRVS